MVGNRNAVAEARSLNCLAVRGNNNDKYSILDSYWRFYWLELSSALVGSTDTKEDFIRCERETQRTTELAAKAQANRHLVNAIYIPFALKKGILERERYKIILKGLLAHFHVKTCSVMPQSVLPGEGGS